MIDKISFRRLPNSAVRYTVYRMPQMTARRVEIVMSGVRWHIGPGGDEW